jgi:microsomal dipeptidase-like Zn-dependent dipeptidase
VPLGGDYWRTPIDANQDGRCRLDTGLTHGKRLESPAFVLRHPYMAFRIGGAADEGAYVALEVDGARAKVERAGGGVIMHEVIWDLGPLAGKTAKIVVSDANEKGILADGFKGLDAPPSPSPTPVWGFADFHAHPMSYLGFGQHVVVGHVDGEVGEALGSCAADHGRKGPLGNIPPGKAGLGMNFMEPAYDHEVALAHIGFWGHGNDVAVDWPRCSTVAHQQMYVDWIRRAWEGGERLMVAHAVNNEMLARSFGGTSRLDDMETAEDQLKALKDFVGQHGDFMEIALSPADARRIIGQGHLAVVPGIEMDAIGGCRRAGSCTDDALKAAIQRLHDQGVRHIFPIHLADNALGGTALYEGMFALLSWYLTDAYQRPVGDPSVAYRLVSSTNPRDAKIYATLSQIGIMAKNLYGHAYKPNWAPNEAIKEGHVNAMGLTDQGALAVAEMIRLGMIIDADHAGQASRSAIYALAKKAGAPVALGHSRYRDLGYVADETSEPAKLKNEAMKTPDDLRQVKDLGGAVAILSNQGDVRAVPEAGVPNTCPGSSTSWLEAYAYAVARMGPRGVGIGTDFDGLAGQPFARFGTLPCTGLLLDPLTHGSFGDDKRAKAQGLSPAAALRKGADAQQGGVTYANPLVDAGKHRFLHAPVRAYSSDETEVWLGLAAWKATATSAGSKISIGVARGFAHDDVEDPCKDAWCRGARAARSGALPPGAPKDVQKAFALVRPIWERWQAMEAGNTGSPLTRNTLRGPQGDAHDFDVNLDGLAHYGLLPDFFQDVANQMKSGQGSVKDLTALFQSAEAYIEMWELAESHATAH